MEKVAEYKTATAEDGKALDEKVKKLIQDGFQPYGNPYTVTLVQTAGTYDVVCQAMVK